MIRIKPEGKMGGPIRFIVICDDFDDLEEFVMNNPKCFTKEFKDYLKKLKKMTCHLGIPSVFKKANMDMNSKEVK